MAPNLRCQRPLAAINPCDTALSTDVRRVMLTLAFRITAERASQNDDEDLAEEWNGQLHCRVLSFRVKFFMDLAG